MLGVPGVVLPQRHGDDGSGLAPPYAISRLIQLMDSDDERVAAVACNSVLDRAFGRPKPVMEEKDDLETRVANMTREERLNRMRELLAPMRQYFDRAR